MAATTEEDAGRQLQSFCLASHFSPSRLSWSYVFRCGLLDAPRYARSLDAFAMGEDSKSFKTHAETIQVVLDTSRNLNRAVRPIVEHLRTVSSIQVPPEINHSDLDEPKHRKFDKS
jgi:hypothetical protein